MDNIDYGNADSYINDQAIEMAWAEKAFQRAEIHMKMLMSLDTKELRLNKDQDVVYRSFRNVFPDMGVQNVTEAELKGDNKSKWADLCESFKEVEDYSLGSLMRMDASKAYTQANTILVPKIIHLAIETARNLEGVNERNKATYTEDYKNMQQ